MRKNVATFFFLVALSLTVYSFFQFPGHQGYEDESYKRVLNNIERGEFKTSRAGYAQTTLQTPLVYFGQGLDKIVQPGHPRYTELGGLLFNPLVTACSVGIFFLIASLFTSRRKSLFLSLLYAFGTMTFPYATIGMEPTSVLFVLASIYFLFLFGQTKARGGLLLFLSGLFYFGLLFSKGYYLVTGPAFLAYLYLVAKQTGSSQPALVRGNFLKYCLFFAAPLLLILPLYFLGNLTTFGVLTGGQYNLKNELLGGESIFFGLYGLILVFGKSIYIYSPALLLSLFLMKRYYKSFPREAVFVLIYSILFVLFVARIHYWTDETWGPRYLISLCAVLLLPLVTLTATDFKWRLQAVHRKLVVTGICLVILASFLFQLIGSMVRYDVVIYSFSDIYKATGYNLLASQEYQYVPQFAPFLVHYRYVANRITGEHRPLNYKIIYTNPAIVAAEEGGRPLIHSFSYSTDRWRNNAINFWWMNVPNTDRRWFLGSYVILFMLLATWGYRSAKSTR